MQLAEDRVQLYQAVRQKQTSFQEPREIIRRSLQLKDHGVKYVYFYQDPQMGGRTYSEQLIKTIHRHAENFEKFSIEFFIPPNRDYLEQLGKLSHKVVVTISPEAAGQVSRNEQGRQYSNETILNLAKDCKALGLNLAFFFLSGVHGDNSSSSKADLWGQIMKITGGLQVSISPMIVPDPGSRAFDEPQRFGYALKHRTLQEHLRAFEDPRW